MGMMVNPYRYASGSGGGGGPFTTLDPNDKPSEVTLSNGNLTATKNGTTNHAWCLAVHGKATGKWFYEFTFTANPGTDVDIGLVGALFKDAKAGATMSNSGSNAKGLNSSSSSLSNGDVVRVIVDADAGLVWFRKNGVLTGGDPQAGTGGTSLSGMTKAYYPCVRLGTANSAGTFNFGASAWASAAEVGYSGWSAVANPVTYAAWRSFVILAKVGGNLVFAAAEVEVMASSGGANLLVGSTGSASHALDSGSFANMIDGNTTTYGAITTNGYATAAQPPGWFKFAFASSATRNATHFAERGRSGAASSQAWTVMDVYLSDDDTIFWKAGANYSLGTFSSTTPGTRNEITL